MEFIIKPRHGVDNVLFGMCPDEVRRTIGVEWTSFKRTTMALHPCDKFEAVGMFVYYTASGRAEAIELSEPAMAIYEGVNLLRVPFLRLANLLRTNDANIEIEADGLTAYGIGVGAYVPFAEEDPAAMPVSIIVFEDGYYGKL